MKNLNGINIPILNKTLNILSISKRMFIAQICIVRRFCYFVHIGNF